LPLRGRLETGTACGQCEGARSAARPATQEDVACQCECITGPVPPAAQGGDDAYKRGIEAQKKNDLQGAFDAFLQAAEQCNGNAQQKLYLDRLQ
jgi:hypothetical protein